MGRLQEELEASMGPWSHRKGSGGGHLAPPGWVDTHCDSLPAGEAVSWAFPGDQQL